MEPKKILGVNKGCRKDGITSPGWNNSDDIKWKSGTNKKSEGLQTLTCWVVMKSSESIVLSQ